MVVHEPASTDGIQVCAMSGYADSTRSKQDPIDDRVPCLCLNINNYYHHQHRQNIISSTIQDMDTDTRFTVE